MHIYIHTYIHIYIYVYTYMYISMYIHIYIQVPSANPPPCLRCLVVWLNGWLIVWLFGWALMYLANQPFIKIEQKIKHKSTNLGSQIHQLGAQNRSQEASWRGPGGLLGRVLGALGGSGGPLGPKMAPRASKNTKNKSFDPLLGAILGPKIDENRSQEPSERWSFFWLIWRSILGAIWCQLGPILAPKTLPKWHQVGSKIDPSLSVDLRGVFWWILDRFLLNFVHNITWPRARLYCKTQWFFNIFDFLLLCCLDDLLIDFLLIFDRFWSRKSSKHLSKIDKKRYQTSNAILDGFWKALGAILGRFWAQVGGQNGAKLAPKSEKWDTQDDVKKWALKHECKITRDHAAQGGGVPINNTIQSLQGAVMGP